MVDRNVALAMMACFLLSLFCGCARKEGEKVITFTVGGAPSEVEVWRHMARQFEDQSGLKVHLLRQPTDTDQRRQGLVVSLKSKKADPDVFLMDVAWIAQFAASGWLEPLDASLEKAKAGPQVFFQSVLQTADTFKDHLIALPVYIDGGLLYYRKDLLQKYGYARPPGTWPELLAYSLRIQEEERKMNPDFYGFVWQGAQYEGLVCTFLEFSGSRGGEIISEGGNVLFNSAPNGEALQYMYDLIHTYKVSPPNTFTEMKEEEVRLFFQQGKALFERNWPYAWALHQGMDSPVRDKVGLAPLPHAPEGQSVSTLGGWHIGISRYSDAKEESFQFLLFVTSYIAQKKLALTLGWNPARTDVYQDTEILEKMPHFSTLGEVFEKACARPALPYYTLISEVVQRQVNGVLSGKITPQRALSTGQKEIQEIMIRYEGR
ncbi:MAG: ABC transporter substrate-binding protein [bacterium]